MAGGEAGFRAMMSAVVAEMVKILVVSKGLKSGREDLNLRPQRPERCALAELRHAP